MVLLQGSIGVWVHSSKAPVTMPRQQSGLQIMWQLHWHIQQHCLTGHESGVINSTSPATVSNAVKVGAVRPATASSTDSTIGGKGPHLPFDVLVLLAITPARDEALSCYIQWCSIALLGPLLRRPQAACPACLHASWYPLLAVATKQQVRTSAPHTSTDFLAK